MRLFREPGKHRSRGQSLVEFALISPIFFLIIFGVFEGGRLVWTYHELNNGTREALRYAMVRGDNSTLDGVPVTDGDIEQVMVDRTAGLRLANLDADILTPAGRDTQQELRIQATYTYEPIIGMIFGSGDITLNSESQGIFSR